MLGVVPVGVDAVVRRDLVVAVVVAQVLAPEPVVVERVLVAVGVGDQDEPQLVRLQQVDERFLVLAVHLDHVLEEPPVDLGADPLSCVLQRRIEDRRAAVVGHRVGVLGQLQCNDVTRRIRPVALGVGAPGLPDHLELEQVRVGGSNLVEVGANAVRPVVGSPDLEARRLLLCGQLRRGHPFGVGPNLEVDAELRDRVLLPGVQDEHDADTALDLFGLDDIKALFDQLRGSRPVDDCLVHLEARIRTWAGRSLAGTHGRGGTSDADHRSEDYREEGHREEVSGRRHRSPPLPPGQAARLGRNYG